jgi:hypothetical protein
MMLSLITQKRNIITSLLALFLVAVIYFLSNTYLNHRTENESHALAVKYENIESISENAQLIVKVGFPQDFSIREVPATLAIHHVTIMKVFKNTTGETIEKGMTIPYSTLLELIEPQSKKKIEVLSRDSINYNGTFLLFLNKVVEDNQTLYVSNSPNHLYKWNGNTKFENINSDTLSTIEESEIN